MKSSSVSSSVALNISRFSASICRSSSFSPTQNSLALLRSSSKCNSVSITTPSNSRLFAVRVTSSESVNLVNSAETKEGPNENDTFVDVKDEVEQTQWNFEVRTPRISVPFVPKLSFGDQAFFLLAFIGCATSVAFTSLVVAAVPTLHAMGRAATSLSRLADTAREELPSTMAAIRLSGMEVSDLTLELSDLSQEIADGVTKSAQAVQAAEAGIRQIGLIARKQTMTMIQERASLPIISLQPVVVGAAKKTSQAVVQATKTIMNMISGGDLGTDDDDDDSGIDRMEI